MAPKHGLSHLPLDVEESVGGCEQQREEDAPEEDGEPAKLHSGNADRCCTVGLWDIRGHLVQKEHPDDKGGGHDGSRVILLPDLHVDVVQ